MAIRRQGLAWIVAMVLLLAWALPADASVIVGTTGDDVLVGGVHNDALYGRKGNDELYGSHGHDYIEGGRGDDVIYGGKQADYIKGGLGFDTCYVTRRDIARGCEALIAPPFWIIELP